MAMVFFKVPFRVGMMGAEGQGYVQKVRFRVETNVPGGDVVYKIENFVYGSGAIYDFEGGIGELSLPTSVGANPVSFEYKITLEIYRRGERPQTVGPYYMAAPATTTDIPLANWPEVSSVPASWMTTATAQLTAAGQAALAPTVAAKDTAVAAAATATTAASTAASNVAGLIAADRTAVATDRAYVEAIVVTDLGTTDGQSKALIESPTSETRAALNNAIGAVTIPVITPEKYGAVGNGVADDTAAVVAAFAAASALRTETKPYTASIYSPGATLALRPSATYRLATLAGPLEVSCNLSAGGATLVAPDAYAGSVLLIGHAGNGKVLHDADMTLPTIEKATAVTTLTPGSVGVQIQNLHHSRVKFGRVQRFETGHWYTAYGHGTVYNEINPGWVDLCKVAHRFSSRAGGWVNQNTFKGGGISQSPNIFDGGTLTDRKRTGWRHVVMDKGATNWVVNANTFVGLSYEGDLSEYHFDFSYATHNAWLGGTRFEQGSTAKTATVSGSTITSTGHGLLVGDVVVFLSDTSPGGMIAGQRYPYHVVSTPDANTFSVAETRSGTAVTFTTAGSNVVFYTAPRLRFDGTDGNCHNNVIQEPFYAYPGPLNLMRVNKAVTNLIAPARPQQGEHPVNLNLITNGNFRINQRGYISGASLASGAIGFDRWRSMSAGTTITFTASPTGQMVTIAAGGIEQRLEREDTPAGTYTLSWKGTATARVYNTGASAPAFAASPLTVDLDGAAHVAVEFGTGTLGDVQFERGTIVTPLARVPMAVELLRCQRHFVRFGAPTGATVRDPIGMAVAYSATQAWMSLQFPSAMRSTTIGGIAGPVLSVTDTTGSTIRLATAGSIAYASAVAASPVSGRGCRLTFTTTGLTPGQALFADTGDYNALLDFSTGF